MPFLLRLPAPFTVSFSRAFSIKTCCTTESENHHPMFLLPQASPRHESENHPQPRILVSWMFRRLCLREALFPSGGGGRPKAPTSRVTRKDFSASNLLFHTPAISDQPAKAAPSCLIPPLLPLLRRPRPAALSVTTHPSQFITIAEQPPRLASSDHAAASHSRRRSSRRYRTRHPLKNFRG